MTGYALMVAVATLGVDFGWQPAGDDGQLEYIIQVEPALLAALEQGEEITSEIHPDARGVRRFRIRVGADPVPRIAPSTEQPPAGDASGADGGPAPQQGSQADSADQPQQPEPAEPQTEPHADADPDSGSGLDPGADPDSEIEVEADESEPAAPERPSDRFPLEQSNQFDVGDSDRGADEDRWQPGQQEAGVGDPSPATPPASEDPRLDGPPWSDRPASESPLGRPVLKEGAAEQPPYGAVDDGRLDVELPGSADAADGAADVDREPAATEQPLERGSSPLGNLARPQFDLSDGPQPDNRPDDAPEEPLERDFDGRPLPGSHAVYTNPEQPDQAPLENDTDAGADGPSLAGSAPPESSDAPSRPWTLLALTALALFASIGGNLYLGWMVWSFYGRCRRLLQQVGQTGRSAAG